MSFRPSGRDDADTLTAFRVGDVKDHTFTHADQVHPLLAMVFPIVNGLDGKVIVDRLRGLIERHAVIAPIGRSFVPWPLEGIVRQEVMVTISFVNGSSPHLHSSR